MKRQAKQDAGTAAAAAAAHAAAAGSAAAAAGVAAALPTSFLTVSSSLAVLLTVLPLISKASLKPKDGSNAVPSYTKP